MHKLLALLTAVGCIMWPTAVARADHAQPGIGLRPVPTELSDPTVRDSEYIVAHAAPGDTFERTLEVYNGEADGTTVKLFGADAQVADGSFNFVEDSPGPSIASWIEIEPDTVTLDHGERRRVVASVTVPPDAREGEYYGLVIAEPPPMPSRDAISTVARIGLRMYLSVAEGGEPASDFVIDSLTSARDETRRPVVSVGVTNTGGRALDLVGELRLLDGPGGLSAGPFPATSQFTLLPADSAEIDIPLSPELPAGPWLARVTMTSGELEREAEATIVFPDEAGASSDPVEATPIFRDRGFLVPLALGLLLLALFLVFLVWWLKRRKDEGEEETDGAGDEPATVVAD